MNRFFNTTYFHPNGDGVMRERTINLGLIKYHSTMFVTGEKDRRIKIGSISIEYAPGLIEVLKRGEVKLMIRI